MSDKILQNKLSKIENTIEVKLYELEKKGCIVVDLNTGKNDIRNLSVILTRAIETISETILVIKGPDNK